MKLCLHGLCRVSGFREIVVQFEDGVVLTWRVLHVRGMERHPLFKTTPTESRADRGSVFSV